MLRWTVSRFNVTGLFYGHGTDYLSDDGLLICEVGNSMVHMMEQYPEIPFMWIEFAEGGHGVFMLTKQQLLDCSDEFALYRD